MGPRCVCVDIPGPNSDATCGLDQKNCYTCTYESHILCEKHKGVSMCLWIFGWKKVLPYAVIDTLLQDLPWMCQNYAKGCREMNGC